MANHYEVLGVSRTATQEEIKRAYRRLARQNHPDANPGDPTAEERFKAITHAYDVLSDPHKRERYDMFGDDKVGAAGFSDFGGISDLFSAFFGSAGPTGRRRPSTRGGDVLAEVEITLEEAASGVERVVEIPTQVTCSECNGSGAAPGTFASRCSDCGGTGEIRYVRRTFLGNVMTASTCPKCDGSGQEITTPCPRCSGQGRMRVTETITLRVPPGIEDGAQLRVSGRGEAGLRGGRSGDLYVSISIAPHAVFRRVGDDLGCEVSVPMTIAALGGNVDIPTLEGPFPTEIDPGTQSGEVVRLKGKGMPRLDGRGRGELVALLKVQTPTGLDEQQAEMLARLAELRGEEIGQRGLFERIKEAFK
ncbi:MAG: molecular chaperone DnaJ [Actinomycetota bacterium]|nr:molecular chaperone DnaJ [Actinomycetota bacterium]